MQIMIVCLKPEYLCGYFAMTTYKMLFSKI